MRGLYESILDDEDIIYRDIKTKIIGVDILKLLLKYITIKQVNNFGKYDSTDECFSIECRVSSDTLKSKYREICTELKSFSNLIKSIECHKNPELSILIKLFNYDTFEIYGSRDSDKNFTLQIITDRREEIKVYKSIIKKLYEKIIRIHN